MLPTLVRFRRDGPLTAAWPVGALVKGFWLDFVAALAAEDRGPLAELVHPAYAEKPAGGGADAVLTQGARVLRGFEAPRLVDFTAVSSVVTLDVVGDWTLPWNGRQVVVQGWPLQLQLQRDGERRAAVRLGLRARRDGGEVTDDGAYWHRGLEVEVRPSGDPVYRTHDELTEMQVMYERSGAEVGGRVRLRILGHRAPGGDQSDEARVWLSGGASVLRRGQRVLGQEKALVGVDDARHEGDVMDWGFPTSGGAFGLASAGSSFARGSHTSSSRRWPSRAAVGRPTACSRLSSDGSTRWRERSRLSEDGPCLGESVVDGVAADPVRPIGTGESFVEGVFLRRRLYAELS